MDPFLANRKSAVRALTGGEQRPVKDMTFCWTDPFMPLGGVRVFVLQDLNASAE